MIRAFGAIAASSLLAPTAPFSLSLGRRPRKTGNKISTSAESAIQTPLGGGEADIADRRYAPALARVRIAERLCFTERNKLHDPKSADLWRRLYNFVRVHRRWQIISERALS